MLLAANAAGAALGGFALEASSFFRQPRERVAVLLAIGWSLAIVAFAVAPVYAVAVYALFVAGLLNLGLRAHAAVRVLGARGPALRLVCTRR